MDSIISCICQQTNNEKEIEGENVTVYGIKIIPSESGATSQFIEHLDISSEKETVSALISIIEQNNVSYIHANDVVEDFMMSVLI